MIETDKPLNLVIKKVFAEQILKGEKTIELRSVTESLARKMWRGAFDPDHLVNYLDIHFQVGYTGKFIDVEIDGWAIVSLAEVKQLDLPMNFIWDDDYEAHPSEEKLYDFLLPSTTGPEAFEGEAAAETYVALFKLGKITATNM